MNKIIIRLFSDLNFYFIGFNQIEEVEIVGVFNKLVLGVDFVGMEVLILNLKLFCVEGLKVIINEIVMFIIRGMVFMIVEFNCFQQYLDIGFVRSDNVVKVDNESVVVIKLNIFSVYLFLFVVQYVLEIFGIFDFWKFRFYKFLVVISLQQIFFVLGILMLFVK